MQGILGLITPVAYASLDTFFKKLNEHIFNPIIYLLIGIAVIYFIYGIFEYIQGSDNEEVRTKGQKHMLWGLVGLSIMVSVFFIIKVILGTFGITEEQIDVETGEVNIGPE